MQGASSQSFPQASERIRSYSRAKILFFVVGLVTSWLKTTIFLASGASRQVSDVTQRQFVNSRVGEGLTVVAFALLSWIASLPLAYLRGYRLEHQYDLSNQTRSAWLGEQMKSLGVQLALMVPVTQVALAIIRRWPQSWWVVLSALTIPFSIVLAHLFPLLIAPLFNTYQPLRDQQLAERLRSLAARSGISVADVMEMDLSKQTRKASAFFTGIGSSKRIVLADTLLDECTHDEIETIVAHEIAHQANYDLWRLMAAGTVTTAVTVWATQRLAESAHARTATTTGIRGLGSVEALPLLTLAGSAGGMIMMPLQNAFSRYIERQADDYALQLTDRPDAFASALGRLSEMNLADPDPSRVEYVLLHSHPTINQRIARCHDYARAAKTN